MGELIDLERKFGPTYDREALGGLFSNARKAATKPFKDAGRAFDKTVLRPVTKPIGAVLKQFDKMILQPIARPIGSVLRQFDKLAIRPVARETNRALKKFDKVAIRGGIKLLDKYVPGWTALIIVFAPPIGIAATLAKGTHTFIKTKGPLLAKLKATSLEAFSGVTLVVSLAATVLTFGTAGPAMVAALTAIQLGLQTVKVGIDLAQAVEVSKKIKRVAKQAKIAGQIELQKIAEEEAKYKAEIEKIKAQIAAVRAEKARVAALKRQAAQNAVRVSPVTRVAKQVGVSNEVVIVAGGLAAIAGVMVVASLIRKQE